MKKGFTLIELLIAVTILGTLSVLTAQSIQQAIKSKIKLQEQIDEVSQARDALRIIEKDINLAFHYRDLQAEIKKELAKIKPLTANPADNYGFPPIPNSFQTEKPDGSTHFIGQSESLDFVTLNYQHMIQDEHDADFAVVGYSVKPCTTPEGDKTNCLFRRLNTFVGKDITKGGSETPFLRYVDEFKLQFIGEGKQDWVKDWNSGEAGDMVTKNHFPDAVEINLAVAKNKDRKVSFQMVVPIRFTNNEPQKKETNPLGQMPQAPFQPDQK